MKKQLSLTPVACALLLLFTGMIITIGCKKDQSNAPVKNTDSPLLTYIKSLGYKDEQIKDIGTDYVVSGDIAYPKNAVINAPDTNSPRRQVDQTGMGTYVAQNVNVIVQVDPSMNAYVAEINAAIAEWNNVPARLKFSIYNGTGAAPNLTITNVDLGGNLCGLANAPLNGQPGSLVRINVNLVTAAALPFLQIQQLIVHEMGHTIGFRHTNWQALGEPQNGVDPIGTAQTAVQIPGTPASDPNSVMNGSTCGAEPAGLSNYDIAAFEFLYSAPIYTRTEFSNYSTVSYDHYGYNSGTGMYYVDGTVDETMADVNIKFYSDFACTQPLTLAAALNVNVIESSTHGPAYTATFNVAAGVNSYLINLGNKIVEVQVNAQDTYDDNVFYYDVTGNNGLYTPLPAKR